MIAMTLTISIPSSVAIREFYSWQIIVAMESAINVPFAITVRFYYGWWVIIYAGRANIITSVFHSIYVGMNVFNFHAVRHIYHTIDISSVAMIFSTKMISIMSDTFGTNE